MAVKTEREREREGEGERITSVIYGYDMASSDWNSDPRFGGKRNKKKLDPPSSLSNNNVCLTTNIDCE